ncbi:hypothetical protein ABBQ32_000324 [Trebouxia sp. C0010 RCD-2024]
MAVKSASAEQWDAFVADRLIVQVETKCATQHITISQQITATTVFSGLDPPAAAAPAALLSSAASEPPPPPPQQQQQQQRHVRVQCQVAIECVVLSVWDDERRRLLAGRAGKGPAPAELCCVYWDQLSLEVSRQAALSTGMYSAPPTPLFVV